MGILLDYNEVGYGVPVSNKIIVATHVDIVERDVKCIGLDELDEENNDCVNDESSDDSFESADEIEQEKIKENKNDSKSKIDFKHIPRKSKRERKEPIKSLGNIYSNNIYANYCSVDTPLTFGDCK